MACARGRSVCRCSDGCHVAFSLIMVASKLDKRAEQIASTVLLDKTDSARDAETTDLRLELVFGLSKGARAVQGFIGRIIGGADGKTDRSRDDPRGQYGDAGPVSSRGSKSRI